VSSSRSDPKASAVNTIDSATDLMTIINEGVKELQASFLNIQSSISGMQNRMVRIQLTLLQT
jgi:hypothetical protein